MEHIGAGDLTNLLETAGPAPVLGGDAGYRLVIRASFLEGLEDDSARRASQERLVVGPRRFSR